MSEETRKHQQRKFSSGDDVLKKSLGVCLVLSFLFAINTTITSAQDAKTFKFNPARLRVGTLYTYRKSNLDGTHPDNVLIYVASKNRLQVLKLEKGVTTGVNIEAELDWQNFMPSKMTMYHDRKDGSHTPIFHLTVDGDEAVLTPDNLAAMNKQAAEIVGKEQRIKVAKWPAHIYGFELISFNFAVQHLRNPKSSFSVGILGDNANFGPDSRSPLTYLGAAQIDYLATEKCQDKLCHKYKLGGEAFKGKEGFFWTDAKFGHITNLEMPLANNGDWDNFKLQFLKSEALSAAQWQKRKAAELAKFFSENAKN
jgi:hypothetical protein